MEGKSVLTDKAFSSENIWSYIENHNGIACIPDKSNTVASVSFLNFELLAAMMIHIFSKDKEKSRKLLN